MMPTEAIEAAAKALRKRFYGYEIELPWDSRDQKTTCRNDAQAALEAAAPYIRAEALEQAASVAETGEGGGTDSGECDDWSAWLRGRAAAERTTDAV